MQRTALIIVLIFSILVFNSCYKPDPVPVEPVIELMDFAKVLNEELSNDTLLIFDQGILSLSFTDGDGDLGQADSLDGSNEPNFFITYFEIQNGDTIEVPLVYFDPIDQEYDTLSFNTILPNMTPEYGAPTAIEGEIIDTLFIYDPASDFDTIMFQAYIIDRAGNQSNTIVTPLILRKEVLLIN